jgi:hypothetical protein
MKFNENPFSESVIVVCELTSGRKDRHREADGVFHRFANAPETLNIVFLLLIFDAFF